MVNSRKIFRYFSAGRLNRKIIQLALPVFLGMLSQTLIHVTDSFMISKLGPSAMAATGLGGTAFFTYIIFLMNGSVGVQIVTARRFGEKKEIEIGRVLSTSIYMAIIGGIFFTFFSLWTGDPFIHFLSDDPNIQETAGVYLRFRNYGLIFFFISFVIRGIFDGIGLTYIGMISSIVTLTSNVFFNWVFIFGNLGSPVYGVKGAAIASTISGFIGMISMLLFLFHPKILYYSKLGKWRFEKSIFNYILNIGIPPAIDGVLTHAAFVFFNKLSGMIGTYSLAANNIIFAIITLSFMPGFSFGIAGTTLLGKAMGELKFNLARIATYRSAFFAAILMGMMGFIFIIFAKQIITGFNPDPLLLKETYLALIIISIAQIGDAYHMVMASALRSAGLVFWVLFVYMIISYLVMLPIAYILGIYLEYGTAGLWSSISIWLFILSIIFLLKFQKGDWKRGRV